MYSPRRCLQGWSLLSLLVLLVSIVFAYLWTLLSARTVHEALSKAPLPLHTVSDASSSESPTTSAPEQVDDTTAIVLNWSRFSNVRRIVKLLCSPELNGMFESVMIWNNNPKPVLYEDFDEDIACSPLKLVIVNSPQNLYFQARFLACMSTNTTFCYVQDDDYLVLPEVLHALHARVFENDDSHAVYLLPPHERLSSDLRHVYNNETGLHTSFAWLGHGAMLRRSLVSQFLSLMQQSRATEEQFKMADNYFSILANRPVEAWFDQGIELGGGQAFTIGSEGEQRNRLHINQAGIFLDALLSNHSHRGDSQQKRSNVASVPIAHAPCIGRPCILKTSIELLPVLRLERAAAQDMLHAEERALSQLSSDTLQHYLLHAPSMAVDTNETSTFKSFSTGRKGDYISLDMLNTPQSSQTEIIWLVSGERAASVLRKCAHESSNDAKTWVASSSSLVCSGGDREDALLECAVPVLPARHFRARLLEDVQDKWSVNEVWIREI